MLIELNVLPLEPSQYKYSFSTSSNRNTQFAGQFAYSSGFSTDD